MPQIQPKVRTRVASVAFSFAALSPAALVTLTPAAYAQTTAQVTGTVTDSSGAIVPGATVVIKNTDTNATHTVTANGDGIYSFTNLQPGSYSVIVTLAGFSPFNANVVVTVGGHFDVNAKLSVGNSTTIEVSSDQAAQVNTTTPEVSQVITSDQITQLPSLTRNPYDFVQLSGNISAGDNTSGGGVQNGANRGVNFSLNGQRNSGTEILLDGVENVSVFSDQVAVRVPIDAVQEYRVITNNFSPEYGRASGGVVALATKSGTNAVHGTVFEFNRISALTSNTVANAQQGITKGVYTRNQFGGAIGGPIVKDKLFFFGAAEFIRVRSAAASTAVILSPQLLAATPANVQSFINTYGGTPSGTVVSTTTNLQAGTTNAAGVQQPLYPTLAPSLPLFSNISYIAPGDAGGGLPQNRYNILGRVDYNLSDRTQLFFRYVDDHEIDQPGSGSSSPYSQYNVGQSTTGQTYLFSAAHTFNSSFSTLGKLSFTRINALNQTYNTALQNVPTLDIASSATDPLTGKPFDLPGFYPGMPGNGGLPFGGPQNTVQYNQDVTLTKGRHNIQAGGQVLYIQDNEAYGAYAQAVEELGNSRASGLQALLTGNLFQFESAVNPNGATPCVRNPYTGLLQQTPACTIQLPASQPNFARSDRFHDWAGYGQDQWKLSKGLTLNYGVRYEYFGVQHNNNPNLDSNFFYGAGSTLQARIRSGQVLTVPNSPNKRLWNPQYGTVSPRLGFAYDVFGDGKTSIRGGYGISYERNFGNVTFNLIQNPPNYAVIVVKPTTQAGVPVPVTNSDLGQLAGASGSIALPPTSLRHVDQNIRTAQTQFHSLSVDQQLGHGTVLELTYNGARGIHLYDIKNYNIPGSGNLYLGDTTAGGVNPVTLTPLNPQFSNDNNRGSNGDSYYNSFNVQFTTQNIRHTGLSIVANYTFAHALDDLSTTFSETAGSNAFTLGYTNPFNPALDHGNSDFDIRNRFVLAPLYRTPTFLKSRGGYLAQLVSGYQINGIYTVRTGTPFNFYDSTNDSSGYGVPRYNPVSPVTQHTFTKIPVGQNGGGTNTYTLTGATTLPLDNPFVNAALGGISDLGPYPTTMVARNSFRGPGAYNLDCSFSKSFPIYERVHLELRAEAFNVTNHHNLYIQETNLDAANYSGVNPQITAAKGGTGQLPTNDERRFLQFAGKINF